MASTVLILMSALFMTQAFSGCATTEKKSREESTVTKEGVPSGEMPAQTVKTETETTTTEVKKQPSSGPGIIGSTFHVIGVVLAFPFKIIAKTIELIF